MLSVPCMEYLIARKTVVRKSHYGMPKSHYERV